MGEVEILHRELSYAIIGSAMEVHKTLGPGYLEAVYQKALAYEFELRGIRYEEQKPLLVSYKDRLVGEYYADFLVEDTIVLEIKSVSRLLSVHDAQAHHYLTSTGKELAILINFGESTLKYKRIIRTKHPQADKIT